MYLGRPFNLALSDYEDLGSWRVSVAPRLTTMAVRQWIIKAGTHPHSIQIVKKLHSVFPCWLAWCCLCPYLLPSNARPSGWTLIFWSAHSLFWNWQIVHSHTPPQWTPYRLNLQFFESNKSFSTTYTISEYSELELCMSCTSEYQFKSSPSQKCLPYSSILHCACILMWCRSIKKMP